MAKSRKISEETINRALESLKISPSKKYRRGDGSIVTVKNELTARLCNIKTLFSNPDIFNQSVPPKGLMILMSRQHKTITEALKVLRSLAGAGDSASTKLSQARKVLYNLSPVSRGVSGGLVGYDVVLFDGDFFTALQSLEKIEIYFSNALDQAKAAVKGRGKNKPGDPYSDNLIGFLCELYRDMTGEVPKASVDDAGGKIRGKIIKFLLITLREFQYPHKLTETALEIRLRRLKSHETYAYLWQDTKS